MEILSDPAIWLSFFSLLVMELVLGIDNVVFITIMTNKLPDQQRKKALIIGLGFALVIRIIMLYSITWIMTLTQPIVNLRSYFNTTNDSLKAALDLSGRDLILLTGGLFLIFKSVKEINETMEGSSQRREVKNITFWPTVIQIGLLDLVFGLDSVVTAVGMANHVGVMIAAVVVAMIAMIMSSNFFSNFLSKHPSIRLLALAFLILIGVSLISSSLNQDIHKGYIYFAMGFAIFIEVILLRYIKKQKKDESKEVKL